VLREEAVVAEQWLRGEALYSDVMAEAAGSVAAKLEEASSVEAGAEA